MLSTIRLPQVITTGRTHHDCNFGRVSGRVGESMVTEGSGSDSGGENVVNYFN